MHDFQGGSRIDLSLFDKSLGSKFTDIGEGGGGGGGRNEGFGIGGGGGKGRAETP